jgi:hypothetical protein
VALHAVHLHPEEGAAHARGQLRLVGAFFVLWFVTEMKFTAGFVVHTPLAEINERAISS